MASYLNKSGQPITLNARSQAALSAARKAGGDAAGLALFAHVLPAEDEGAKRQLAKLSVRSGDSVDKFPIVRLLSQSGYRAVRPHGVDVFDTKGRTDWDGPIAWSPEVPLPRVDDQDDDLDRRVDGEVALAAVLRSQMDKRGLSSTLVRHVPAAQTRGADFKNSFARYIADRLPKDWEIRSEVPLNHIYGLHMRRDVGARSSDIVAMGPPNRRLFAIISSKASWRTDRGTEAAAMVPLRRYRPDVPYVMVTAEFPRASQILRESPEDRVYHLVPRLWAAWKAAVVAHDKGELVGSLEDLLLRADQILSGLDLPDLDALVNELLSAASVL
jgi:hypothetical protein